MGCTLPRHSRTSLFSLERQCRRTRRHQRRGMWDGTPPRISGWTRTRPPPPHPPLCLPPVLVHYSWLTVAVGCGCRRPHPSTRGGARRWGFGCSPVGTCGAFAMGCSRNGVTRQSTWGVVIHVDAAVSVVHDVAVNLVRGDVRSCCEVRVL